MSHCHTRLQIRHLVLSAACISLVLLACNVKGFAPVGTPLGTLQFDAIMELNAPIMRTHTVLFARYWVASDHYTVALVWSEPHTGNLNFPAYPVGLVIHSNKDELCFSHQVHGRVSAVFHKPLGTRPAFQYKFNAYDLHDIRFAETEALASRIYTHDITPVGDSQSYTFKGRTANDRGAEEPSRDVGRIEARVRNERTEQLSIFSPAGTLLKKVDYEYQDVPTSSLLKEQIEISAHPVVASLGTEGVTVKIDGASHQLRECPITHRLGGRRVIVEYKKLDFEDTTVSLPVHITVARATDNTELRAVRMFNYVRSKADARECKEAARRFAKLDDTEERCRLMLLKYWLKDPAEVSAQDAAILRDLHVNIERRSTQDMTAGEQLKRVNKLLEVDWILGDVLGVKEHYAQYLRVLAANDLNRTMLFGGHEIIETAVRWGYHPLAGEMRKMWIDTVTPLQSGASILEFADREIERGRFWCVAGLLERSLKNTMGTGEQFETSALLCKALSRLIYFTEDAERIGDDSSIMQAGWVASTFGIDKLKSMHSDSLLEAKRLYAKLGEPAQRHKMLMVQIEASLREKEGANRGDVGDKGAHDDRVRQSISVQ
jgi:hypothetical protein